MPTYPAYKLKPYYDALKTWLLESHNEDGTLRSDAVQAEVSAAIASTDTNIDAATMAVAANETIVGLTGAVLADLSTANTAAQNTTALNAAYTQAAAEGKAIVLPPGDFDFLGPVDWDMFSGMAIRGSGPFLTTLTNTATDGSYGIRVGGPSGSNLDHLTIEGFALLGNAASGDGLVVGEEDGINIGVIDIARVRTRLHGGSGIRLTGRIDFITVRHVKSRDNGLHGLFVDSYNFVSLTTILGSSFGNNDASGVHATGTLGCVSMIGSECGGNVYGLSFTDAYNYPRDLDVRGSRFENNTTAQILIDGASIQGGILLESVDFLDNMGASYLTDQVVINETTNVTLRNVHGFNLGDGAALVSFTNGGDAKIEQCSRRGRSGATTYLVRGTDGTLYSDYASGADRVPMQPIYQEHGAGGVSATKVGMVAFGRRVYVSRVFLQLSAAIAADAVNYWTLRVRHRDEFGTVQNTWTMTSAAGWSQWNQHSLDMGLWVDDEDTFEWDLTKTASAPTLWGCTITLV